METPFAAPKGERGPHDPVGGGATDLATGGGRAKRPLDGETPEVERPTPAQRPRVGAAGDSSSTAPPPSSSASSAGEVAASAPPAGRHCVEWAVAPPRYHGGVDDPATAAEAEALIQTLAAKWKAVRAAGDGVTACACGCGSSGFLPTNSAWFQRASEHYRQMYAEKTRSAAKQGHAHTEAYNITKKKFPEIKALHFGAIPGVPPGAKLMNKAHAASIGLHRAIYKGISVRKQQGAWSPVESIALYSTLAPDPRSQTRVFLRSCARGLSFKNSGTPTSRSSRHFIELCSAVFRCTHCR